MLDGCYLALCKLLIFTVKSFISLKIYTSVSFQFKIPCRSTCLPHIPLCIYPIWQTGFFSLQRVLDKFLEIIYSEISLVCIQPEVQGEKKEVLVLNDTAQAVLIPPETLFTVLPNIIILKTVINGHWTDSQRNLQEMLNGKKMLNLKLLFKKVKEG